MGAETTTTAQFNLEDLFQNTKLQTEHSEKLCNTITQEEIQQAISTWPKNKSASLDGFIGEFYQRFRDIIIPNLLSVFHSIIETRTQILYPLNDSSLC